MEIIASNVTYNLPSDVTRLGSSAAGHNSPGRKGDEVSSLRESAALQGGRISPRTYDSDYGISDQVNIY